MADLLAYLVSPFAMQDTHLQCYAFMFQWQSFHLCPPYELIFNRPVAITSCSFADPPTPTESQYLSSSVSSLYCPLLFIPCFTDVLLDVILIFTNYFTV